MTVATVSKPPTLEVRAKNIPAELMALHQFVVWSWEERDGRRTKPPRQPANPSRYAKSTDPSTWGTSAQALAAYEHGDVDGIGVALTNDDPYTGIDLDHVRDPDNGTIEPGAMDIVKAIGSYTEISPSGTGLRIFVRGRLPESGRKRGDVEAYDSGRYLTLTGHVLEGFDTIVDGQAELDAFHAAYLTDPEHEAAPTPPRAASLDDEELLAKARSARNGAAFDMLYRGEWESAGHPSQSEGDLALTDHLTFWTGGDPVAVDRLFRGSGLYRDKWDERRGARTYGEATIARALEGATEFYSPTRAERRRADRQIEQSPEPEQVVAPPWTPTLIVTEEQMALAGAEQHYVSRFVAYASRRTDAPPEFLAAVAWSLLSVVIGRRARLRLTVDDVYATLWLLAVADSTLWRKSTALNLGRDQLSRSAEGLLVPDDFSPQRLVGFMAEHDGEAALLMRDEWSGLYASLNRAEFMLGAKQVMVALFDGRPYQRQLMGTKRPGQDRVPEIIRIEHPFLSIMAATQTELLLDQAKPEDVASGFLPRFSMIRPHSRPQRKDVDLLHEHTDHEAEQLATELRTLGRKGATDLRVEDGVLAEWNAYQATVEDQAEEAPLTSIAGPVFQRHAMTALKLAMLLAFARDGIIGKADLAVGIVQAESWRLGTYEILTAIGPNREEKLFQRAADFLRRKGDCHRRDLMQALRLDARTTDILELTLEQRGVIDIIITGKTRRYRTLPDSSTFAAFEGLSNPYTHARRAHASSSLEYKGLDKHSNIANNDDPGEL